MTIFKFFGFFFLQWIIFSFAKIWLINTEVFANPTFQNIVYYFIIFLITTALFRRFGVITYIETVFALVFWVFVGLFFDLIITSNYTGLSLFKSSTYWIGLAVLIISALLFHKKRHIQIRKELHAHHHGHGGHH
jgi:hypothetical protein